MRFMLFVAFSIAAIGLAPHRTVGQPSAVVARSVAPLSSLRRNAVLRLATVGRYTEGRFQRVTTDSLFLAAATVSVATLDSVWVRGRAMRKGALIGGIVGGLTFTAIGVALSQTCLTSFKCEKEPAVIPVAAAVGVVAGGLIGSGLGSLGHVWRLVHP